MLTTLTTLKTRLAILETDTTSDLLLANAINAIAARFDHETNRTLARTVDATYEFDAGQTEVCVPCYPIETVAKFEVKSSEATGWVEQPGVEYLIRQRCVISLCQPLAAGGRLARVTYTGGYVMPGSPPLEPPVPASQTLPADLEQTALDQLAFWFQNRDRQGLQRQWEYHGLYRQFADLDLLTSVRAVLARYARWAV